VSASARPSLPLPDLQYDWKAGKVRIQDRVRLNDQPVLLAGVVADLPLGWRAGSASSWEGSGL
jgi:hypothetical protein